ncbi:MAG: arsenate reductase (glutaredoxin) [Sphingomonadaceae bacterium]
MNATIYHNPACGTSRKTLEILENESGVTVDVVEYLKMPPTRDRLVELYMRAGITPREGLRTHGDPAAQLVAELRLDSADDDAILDAMMAHPILINRPLVETEKGVRLCRPQEVVREIL